MSKALDIVYAAHLAGDEEAFAEILKENWPCLSGDEKWFLKVLRGGSGGGGGGSVDSSLGGFDSADAGKVAEFDVDGSLAATNFFRLFKGVGHVNGFTLDASAASGERTQTFTDGSGILSLKVTDIPVNSTASGKPGMWAADSDFLYICTAVDTWRRCDLSIF